MRWIAWLRRSSGFRKASGRPSAGASDHSESLGPGARRLREAVEPARLTASLARADRIVRLRHAAGRGAVILSTGAEISVSRRHMGALKAMSRSHALLKLTMHPPSAVIPRSALG